MTQIIFDYQDGCFEDFIIVYLQLTKNLTFRFRILIAENNLLDLSDFEVDIWYKEIYEKCSDRDIPEEYLELDDYYKNPDDPKMTKNIKKIEFCLSKDNMDDYLCGFDECPKRM